jgi:hypothetical protein
MPSCRGRPCDIHPIALLPGPDAIGRFKVVMYTRVFQLGPFQAIVITEDCIGGIRWTSQFRYQ